jgi:acetyl esterase/lipase
MDMVRQGEAFGSNWIDGTPSGVKINEFKLTVDHSQLLWYEKAGLSYQAKTEAWRYPIPEEAHELYSNVYELEAEWVVPDIAAQYSKKSKRRSFALASNEKDFYTPRKVILYLHGGAYILGNIKIYRSVTGILAKNSGHPILAVNYRMAPEHPFPAGLHDSLAAYLFLLKPGHPMFGGTATHEPYDQKVVCVFPN